MSRVNTTNRIVVAVDAGETTSDPAVYSPERRDVREMNNRLAELSARVTLLRNLLDGMLAEHRCKRAGCVCRLAGEAMGVIG